MAYSPEREDPGNQNFSPSKIPKVIGAAQVGRLAMVRQL